MKGISAWNKNNQSPRLSVPAVVVSRSGQSVTHHSHAMLVMRLERMDTVTSSSTWYYVTFQVESGDRMRFLLSAQSVVC